MLIGATKQSLLNLPRTVKKALAIFFDLILCCMTVWLAFGVRLDQWDPFWLQGWIVVIFAISFSLPLFVFFGLYRAIFRYVGSEALISLTRVFGVYASLFFFVFTIIGIDDVPRSIGVIQPILLFIGVGASRFFLRHWLGDINNAHNSNRVKPVALIYGAGAAGRQLAAGLSSNKEMLVKCFVDDDPSMQGNTVNNISVYPNIELDNLIKRFAITDVLLAIPSAKPDKRRQIITSLNGCGVRVRTLPGLIDLAAGRVRISDLHDLDMNDLLGRAVVPPKVDLLEKNIRNQVVLVTGAGG